MHQYWKINTINNNQLDLKKTDPVLVSNYKKTSPEKMVTFNEERHKKKKHFFKIKSFFFFIYQFYQLQQ